MIAAMKVTLITRFKDVAPNGDLMEMVVWRVPKPVPLRKMNIRSPVWTS